MFLRILVLAAVVLGSLAPMAEAASRTTTRQEIRSKPILERPNRVGHVYGNTVRRRHHRQTR